MRAGHVRAFLEGRPQKLGRLLTRPSSLNVATADVPVALAVLAATAPEDRLAYGGLCAPLSLEEAAHASGAGDASSQC